MKAQTINIALEIISNDPEENYLATFYIYERHYGAFCPMVSTYVISGLSPGVTKLQLSYMVPYETNHPLFRVGVVVTGEDTGHDQMGATSWSGTYDLCSAMQCITVLFP